MSDSYEYCARTPSSMRSVRPIRDVDASTQTRKRVEGLAGGARARARARNGVRVRRRGAGGQTAAGRRGAGGAHRRAGDALGRHVGGGADQARRLCRAGPDMPKSASLDLAARVEQHVGRLDVAVHHLEHAVQVVEPAEHVARHAREQRLGQRTGRSVAASEPQSMYSRIRWTALST